MTPIVQTRGQGSGDSEQFLTEHKFPIPFVNKCIIELNLTVSLPHNEAGLLRFFEKEIHFSKYSRNINVDE